MKLVYSYSHKDEHLREGIEKHLALLRDEGLIDEWYDRKILPGQAIHDEFDSNLETADLVLLVLSPDFLASPECMRELRIVLDLKAKNDALVVVPVIARPCAWKDLEGISGLLAIPTDGKPITKWENEDDALHDIYENIRKIVTHIPFRLKTEFRDDLTQVEFISQHKENIRLDDLFVFPNVKAEFSDRGVNGFEDLWKKNKRLVLKGDDRSGKTVFCRKLLLSEIDKGNPAILVSGNDIRSPRNHERLIKEVFKEQFNGSFSHWKSKPAKLLIIDDFSHNSHLNFVDFAKDYFERILIVTSEDDFLVYFKDEGRLAGFELLSLRSLGHVNQEILIKKWIGLSNTKDQELSVTHGKIDQIEDQLNSIILHNRIVPRYPFYILSILQTFEAFMPQSLQITAYGHCYQALITAQLINIGVSKEDIDSALNFLSHFAFEVFDQSKCSQDQYEQFLERYEQEFIVKDSVVNRLMRKDSSIIRMRNGGYEFNHPFIYYFLLGHYFARNYEVKKGLIEELARKSYVHDNAYILIFTIHHTQNDDLINTMIHSAYAFDSISPATLSTDETRLLEGILEELPERILSNRPVEEERRIEREQRDENEAELEELPPDDSSEKDTLNDFYRALKNMEILGQILRNKYGSLPREKLKEVVSFVADAGLRLINIVTDRDAILSFEGYFIEELKSVNIPEDDKQKIQNFLKRQIRTLVFVSIGSLLRKILISIRKPELQKVVDAMCRENGTPAYDLLRILFILETSESLSTQSVKQITDTFSKFEGNRNTVPKRLLSLWLQHYANTHEINYRLREKLFDALGLSYQPNPLKKPRLS